MKKCRYCGEEAIIRLRYANLNLCREHFIEYYEKRGLLVRIDASRSVDDIWREIKEVVDGKLRRSDCHNSSS